MDAHVEIARIAAQFGLSLDDLGGLLVATDKARGLCTAADVEVGLRQTIMVYLGVFSSAAERIIDPQERRVVEHFLGQATDALVEQLSAAPHRPN